MAAAEAPGAARTAPSQSTLSAVPSLMNLKKMTIARRLALGFRPLLVMMAGLAAAGAWALQPSSAALVAEAGRTMQAGVADVRRLCAVIGEISAAAMEQGQGIEQGGQAVTQRDQTTQQNAALVEKSAAAAESLKAQAARLAQVVAVFRMEQPAGV